MSVLLAIDNQPVRSRGNLMPALCDIANTLLAQLAEGRTDDAIRFMRRQNLPPIALGFVATRLLKRGIGEQVIESVLLR